VASLAALGAVASRSGIGAEEGREAAAGHPWNVLGLDGAEDGRDVLGAKVEAGASEAQGEPPLSDDGVVPSDGVTVSDEGIPGMPITGGRALLRTAHLGLVIPGRDVGGAADRVALITQGLGGYVISSWTGTAADPVIAFPEGEALQREEPVLSQSGIETATVTVRVPAESFETALRRFARLGEVDYRQTSTEDVTEQMVDLEARLRHARAVERRLLRFLEATATIREMLAVQDRLDQVQLEIEQLSAQIASLREVVDFSTIAVSLRAEGDAAPVIGESGGVWDNFIDAWRLIGRGAHLLVLAAAAALPFVIVFGALGALAWYGRRRFGRRQAGHAGAEGTA
jgi:hypothetical protein